MKKQITIATRALVTLLGMLAIWFLITQFSAIPSYLLPPPKNVAQALINQRWLLWHATQITFVETILGLLLGCLFGSILALLMMISPLIRRWLMPLVLISQSIPVFALAPLLVLWLDFGIKSKIAMAVLMIFFPVTSSFFDGLRNTPQGWLDLAQTMNATSWRKLFFLRIPAAMSSFASGLRVATAIAPIGAVVGEWVGASAGLGFLMQDANNHFQTDLMFAALFILSIMTMSLWGLVDFSLKKLIPWEKQTF